MERGFFRQTNRHGSLRGKLWEWHQTQKVAHRETTRTSLYCRKPKFREVISNNRTHAVTRTYPAHDRFCTLPTRGESSPGASRQKDVEATLTVVPEIIWLGPATRKREGTYFCHIRVGLSDSLRISGDDLRDIGEPATMLSPSCVVHARDITLQPERRYNSRVTEAVFDVETCRIRLRS